MLGADLPLLWYLQRPDTSSSYQIPLFPISPHEEVLSESGLWVKERADSPAWTHLQHEHHRTTEEAVIGIMQALMMLAS